MTRLVSLATWALPLLYLALLIDCGTAFFLRIRIHTRSRRLVGVVVAHAVFLVLLSVLLGRPAVVTNPEILSVVALSTAAVYAVVEAAGHDRRTGAFVLLLVFLFQYTSSFFLAVPGPAAVVAQPRWERLHVILAILAYAALSISAVYGLLHLVVQRNLKRHRFGPLFDRLPPLDLLARMSWRAVFVGFVFITLTILTSAGLAATGRLGPAGQVTFWNPKVTVKLVVGSVAWLIYTVAVVGKFVGKWPASRVSLIAVNGFVAIAVLFVVSAALS